MPHKRPGSKYVYITVGGRAKSARTADWDAAAELERKENHKLWEHDRLGVVKTYSWNEAVLERVNRIKTKREVKSTWRDEQRYLAWWQPFLEKVDDLNNITRDLIRDTVLANRPNVTMDKRHPTPENTTANKYVNAVSNILNRAERFWGWKGVRAPVLELFPTPTHRKVMPTAAQILALCEELPEHSADITLFSAVTALRRGTMMAMEWEWIDWQNRTISVPGWAMKCVHSLDIPLNDTAMAVLARRRAVKNPHIKYVFTYRGERLGTVTTKHFHAAAVRAGLGAKLSVHWMRHWANSMLIKAKVEKSIRCRLGGWALPKDANEIYAHMTPADLREYSEVLHNLFVAGGIEKTRFAAVPLKSHGLTVKPLAKVA